MRQHLELIWYFLTSYVGVMLRSFVIELSFSLVQGFPNHCAVAEMIRCAVALGAVQLLAPMKYIANCQ